MIFSSFSFLWIFFPIVFLLYRILPKEHPTWRNTLLLLASLVFYSWGQRYLLLLVVCILVDYAFGFLIGADKLPAAEASRKNTVFLAVAVLFNLLVLGYFKYFAFAVELINKAAGSSFEVGTIIAPVGVSFFTFKSISYLVDIYRRKLPRQKNLISLGLYISFFPHIMSGPIAQYEEMAAQIDAPRELDAARTAYGIKRFIYGFAKKVLIADQLGSFVDSVFGMSVGTVPGSWYWLSMVCYTLQIYFDFSGYSDMAIGLGETFGFTIRENFNYPYLSRSLREFWRRWHMSLNRWFQNYLYIPLGGSRRGKTRTLVNLMIVFFVTGLWHGAGLNFIAWGLWHGAFMLLERTSFGKWLEKPRAAIFSRIYTLFVVAVGWMMFRANGLRHALRIFQSMFSLAAVPATMPLPLYLSPRVVVALVLALLLCGPVQALFPAMERRISNRERTGLPQTIWLLCLFVVCLLLTMSGTYSSFIYFKF